jgi:ribonuclease M5
MEKPRIKLPVVVEGRYDKSTLLSMFSATVVTTGGFSVFNSKEKRLLIKRLAEGGGIILLTDPDAGGKQIRSFISGILPKDKIFNLYVPKIEGKERRKRSSSKAGLLGVEGMGREVLMRVLDPFIDRGACEEISENEGKREVTKLDFFNDGLSGGENSSEKRARLAEALLLPTDMSAKALLEAVNLVCGYDEYKRIAESL